MQGWARNGRGMLGSTGGRGGRGSSSSGTDQCTPSHAQPSNMQCRHFSPTVDGLNETEGQLVVMNSPPQNPNPAGTVDCVCTGCVGTGPEHDCGDGNDCYTTCASATCNCDEVVVGPSGLNWQGGVATGCVLGRAGGTGTSVGEGECATIPA